MITQLRTGHTKVTKFHMLFRGPRLIATISCVVVKQIKSNPLYAKRQPVDRQRCKGLLVHACSDLETSSVLYVRHRRVLCSILIHYTMGPFYQHGLTLIQAWISNLMFSVGWKYVSISKLQRLHRWSLGWIRNFIPHFLMNANTYSCCDYFFFMLVKGSHVIKNVSCTNSLNINFVMSFVKWNKFTYFDMLHKPSHV